MSEHWIDRLSDYLDDDLSNGERAALERHLLECAKCATALAEIRQVTQRAHELPERAPDTNLWAGIESRIALSRRALESARRARRAREPRPWFDWIGRRLSLSIPQLAAAAAALVIVSAGAMWFVVSRGAAPAPAVLAPVPAPTTSVASFDETRYGRAIAELEDALRQHRAELDTSTVRILEENLALIDQATLQARRALAADPGNPYLNGHLAEQLKRKIWLLQRATAVVAAQG